MGVSVSAQTHRDSAYVRSIDRVMALSWRWGCRPWLWLRPIARLTGFTRAYNKQLKVANDFTRQVVAERLADFDASTLQESRKRRAFLDLLLSVAQEDGTLTEEDLCDEVKTFMFAGHDTTASGMAWTLWLLANYRDQQELVIKELDDIFGTSDRECTTEDLTQMRYLEQCLKEAHRLLPPAPYFFRRVDEQFECCGYTVPRGVTLLISPLLVHLNSEASACEERFQYFEKPYAFYPPHFSAEATAKRHPFAYIPFSAGARNCIGQKFALMEEKTCLSWFFRRFRVTPAAAMFKTFPLPEIILKPSRGIPVRIHRRRGE